MCLCALAMRRERSGSGGEGAHLVEQRRAAQAVEVITVHSRLTVAANDLAAQAVNVAGVEQPIGAEEKLIAVFIRAVVNEEGILGIYLQIVESGGESVVKIDIGVDSHNYIFLSFLPVPLGQVAFCFDGFILDANFKRRMKRIKIFFEWIKNNL